jgi:hypothetical protein
MGADALMQVKKEDGWTCAQKLHDRLSNDAFRLRCKRLLIDDTVTAGCLQFPPFYRVFLVAIAVVATRSLFNHPTSVFSTNTSSYSQP